MIAASGNGMIWSDGFSVNWLGDGTVVMITLFVIISWKYIEHRQKERIDLGFVGGLLFEEQQRDGVGTLAAER